MRAAARLPSGCRDTARREVMSPAPRPQLPEGAEHAVTVDQQLMTMTLNGASELVHSVLRSSDADGSALILTSNIGAESKNHRAVAFRVFENV